MTCNYDLLSLFELSNELDKEYNDYENSWKNCNNENEKKIAVVNTLRWCKRNRDMFEDVEPFTVNELSTVTEHETKWSNRTMVWRSRFNQYYRQIINNN